MKILYYIIICFIVSIFYYIFYKKNKTPIKATIHGSEYVCYGSEINGLPHGNITCMFNNSDQIKYKFNSVKGKFDGKFIEYYRTGVLRDSGHYSNDKQVGTWTRHYKSGQKEWIRIYSQDSIRPYYSKYFDKNGGLYSCKLPIKISIKEEEKIAVGDTVTTNIQLLTTTLDTAFIACFISNPNTNFLEDTVSSFSTSVEYSFIAKKLGLNEFNGILVEINTDFEQACEYPFKFTLYVYR